MLKKKRGVVWLCVGPTDVAAEYDDHSSHSDRQHIVDAWRLDKQDADNDGHDSVEERTAGPVPRARRDLRWVQRFQNIYYT